MFILDSDHLSILQYEEGAEFDRLTEMMRQHSPTDFL